MPIPNWFQNVRDKEWLLPLAAAVLAILVVLPTTLGPAEHIYPVRADSAKYQEMAEGVSLMITELPSVLGKMVSGKFTDADRARYHLDSDMLQHAPGYLFLLGAVYSGTSTSPMIGRLVTLVLFAASAALLGLWTRRRFGAPAAILAVILFVFWPSHQYYATAIMTEIPMIFFALLAVVSLDLSRQSRSWLPVSLGGLALGLLSMTKLSFRFVIPPILFLDLLGRWKGPDRLRFFALRAAGVLLAMVLWSVFLQSADILRDPMGSRGESALWIYRGNYIPDRGFESMGLGDVTSPQIRTAVGEIRDLPEEEKQKAIYSRAFELTVKSDPTRWMALVAAKVKWFWEYPAIKTDTQTWFGSIDPPARLQPVLVLFGVVGLAVALLRGWSGLMPALIASYICAIHASTHLVSRYNIPAFALLLPYSAFGVAWTASTVWGLRRSGPVRFWLSQNWPKLLGLSMPAMIAGLLAAGAGRDAWIGSGMHAQQAFYFQNALELLAWLLWIPPFVYLSRRERIAWLQVSLAALILLAGPALTTFGERHSDRDPDVWRARLSRPGDRIEQVILIPKSMDWNAVSHVELLVDMLPSLDRSYSLSVRVNGTEVDLFENGIESKAEDFRVSRKIHAVQDRYSRGERAVIRHHEGFVQSRYPEVGFEYYRQWFRLAVPIELVRNRDRVQVELVLETTDGGYVDCYGDMVVGPSPSGNRLVLAPAFFENPYNLSTYQFELMASNREKADLRFVRPTVLMSPEAYSQFYRNGKSLGNDLSPHRGMQPGEYRIRIRTKLHGRYVYREDPERPGKPQPTWAVWPKPDDRPLDADDLRFLSGRRDIFFDGYRTY